MFRLIDLAKCSVEIVEFGVKLEGVGHFLVGTSLLEAVLFDFVFLDVVLQKLVSLDLFRFHLFLVCRGIEFGIIGL